MTAGIFSDLVRRRKAASPLSIILTAFVGHLQYGQAGIQATGTHLLRRTFATRLHQHGASVKLAADFLGHKDLGTAAVYARVNLKQLRRLALPWPKASP